MRAYTTPIVDVELLPTPRGVDEVVPAWRYEKERDSTGPMHMLLYAVVVVNKDDWNMVGLLALYCCGQKRQAISGNNIRDSQNLHIQAAQVNPLETFMGKAYL